MWLKESRKVWERGFYKYGMKTFAAIDPERVTSSAYLLLPNKRRG